MSRIDEVIGKYLTEMLTVGDVLKHKKATRKGAPRSISLIAKEIRQDWSKVNYAAKPYLDAMGALEKITDKYYMDSGASVVAYFLANAQTWKGEKAKATKKELNKILKDYYKSKGIS